MMDHQIFKIYNQEDFNRITKGIKVAQCMQSRSSSGNIYFELKCYLI